MSKTEESIWYSTFRGKPPVIGETAERVRHISVADVEDFARLSGDYNPIHFDEDFIAESMFDARIAHGGLVIGAISEVGAQDLPGPGSVFLNADWRFVAPVFVPDEVTSRAEVLEVRHDKPIVVMQHTVIRSDGQIVLEGKAVTYVSPKKSLMSTRR